MRSPLPALVSVIYDHFISKPITCHTYHRFLCRLSEHGIEKVDSLLDVGVGTGLALHSILSHIPQSTHILGIDINENYVNSSQRLFQDHDNVKILFKNFHDLVYSKKNSFDIILFSSSFMLMPEKEKTLQIAKKLLKKEGKIYFILTLFDKKSELIEKCKPLLKYVTTIDFGNALTEKHFFYVLRQSGIEVTYRERIQKNNLWFNLCPIFLVEGQVCQSQCHRTFPLAAESLH